MGLSTENKPDESLRGNIATKILAYGIWALATISIIIIIAAIVMLFRASGTPAEMAAQKDKAIALIVNIFQSLLPVIATWIGTVIAFYFGAANFEAANKSVEALVKQITNTDDKLKATKISDKGVMRSFAEINYNIELSEKAFTDILIQKDLLEFIDLNQKGDRLPILDSKKAVRCIIHESTLNEFARKLTLKKFETLAEKTLDVITLEELTNNTDEEMKMKITKSAEFVSKTATLFDANEKMKLNKYCQDVFVTENGKAEEEIIGWVTNNKVAEFCKI